MVTTNGQRFAISAYNEDAIYFVNEDMGLFYSDDYDSVDISGFVIVPTNDFNSWDIFESNMSNTVLLAYLHRRFPGNSMLYVLIEQGNDGIEFNVFDDMVLLSLSECRQGSAPGPVPDVFSYGVYNAEVVPIIMYGEGDDTGYGYCDCNGKLIADGDRASAIGLPAYAVPHTLRGATAVDLCGLVYAITSGIDVSAITDIPARCGIPIL